ncbi:MAG: HAD family hydrolase [Clostridia bacterium]|nr:HAD family hydrolase [Clostridia bacterium]
MMSYSSNKKYKIAIFDMDGTLVDSLYDIAVCYNTALRTVGLPERTPEQLKLGVGLVLEEFNKLQTPPDTPKEKIDELNRIYYPIYAEHRGDHAKPFPGIPEMLRKLKNAGLPIAVVSNNDPEIVGAQLESFLPGLIEYHVGAAAGIRPKPHPDTILAVLDKYGLNKSEAVFIGDSDIDIKAAVNAGVDSIGVTWGFRDSPTLADAGADMIADTAEELLSFIMG